MSVEDNKVDSEINQLRLENKNLKIVANASMATSGRIKKKAFELGYDPSKELNELDYLFYLLDKKN